MNHDPDTVLRPHEWATQALCRAPEADPEWWDAHAQTAEAATARAWCGRCPVTAECLALAMGAEGDSPSAYRAGIFGGLGPSDRGALGGQRREATS